MGKRNWIFLINTFYVNTYYSVKKMLSLTTDHLAKLFANMADADIAAIYNDYLPIHQAFMTAYNLLQSKLGLYHGKTQTFEEMIEHMTYTELNVWRGKVFSVFPEGTPNATAIFPQGKKPFYDGTYEQRVEAVETLGTTLATFTGEPALITLAAQVDAYHANILGARALQQTDEGSTETLRTNLKNAHKTLADWMYRNLGRLMSRYYTDPLQIENYFDLSLLRAVEEDENMVTFHGVISDSVTNVPVEGVTVTVGTHTATSEADGNYELNFTISELTTLPVVISKPGYETISTTLQINPGQSIIQDLSVNRIVLTTYQQTVAVSATLNFGTVTAGATGLRITLINGVTITVGLSPDGINMGGTPVNVGGMGTIADHPLDDFGISANDILVQNTNGSNVAEVKVEVLG